MFLFMFLFFIVRALAVTKSMNFSVKLHHTVMPWILKPLIKFGEDSVDLLMLKSGRRSNSAKKRATFSYVTGHTVFHTTSAMTSNFCHANYLAGSKGNCYFK